MRKMNGGMKYEQKDIILIPFPYSDLTGAKKRPALILSNTTLKGDDKICCLITSNAPEEGIEIPSLNEGNLPFKSWAKPQRIFTVDTRIIHKKLGSVTGNFHSKVVKHVETYLS